MPNLIRSIEQNGVLYTFVFDEVNLKAQKKYFVTAFGEKHEKVVFEMKPNGYGGWYIIEPVTEWVTAFGKELSRVLEDEG